MAFCHIVQYYYLMQFNPLTGFLSERFSYQLSAFAAALQNTEDRDIGASNSHPDVTFPVLIILQALLLSYICCFPFFSYPSGHCILHLPEVIVKKTGPPVQGNVPTILLYQLFFKQSHYSPQPVSRSVFLIVKLLSTSVIVLLLVAMALLFAAFWQIST